MVAVRVVQVAVHQVIDVIAVRNLLVAATRSVDVRRVVRLASVFGGAGGRVGRIDGELVFIDVVAVHVVQVAVVQVVGVLVVFYHPVAAVRAVTVVVFLVNSTLAHGKSSARVRPLPCRSSTGSVAPRPVETEN